MCVLFYVYIFFLYKKKQKKFRSNKRKIINTQNEINYMVQKEKGRNELLSFTIYIRYGPWEGFACYV